MVTPTRRLWRSVSGHRRELIGAGLIGMLASLCAVALLGTSAWLISTAAELPPVLTLSVAAVMVRAFALGRALFRYVERLVGHDAAFRGLADARVAIYERLEVLTPVGLARFTRGDLLSRLVADVDAALDLPLRIVLPWVQATLVALITAAFCIWLAPPAGILIAVLALLALSAAPWLVGRLAARAERRIAPTRAVLSGAVVTALDAGPDLLAFGCTGAAAQSVRGVDDSLTGLVRRSAWALGIGGGVTTVLQGAAVVGVLALTIPRVADGTLGPVWLAVIALLPLALFEVIGTLPSAALALQRVRGSAERLAEVADQPDPVTVPRAPLALPAGFTGLQAEELSAGWQGTTTISGITIRLDPGERLWIVGPSGAGKSTLAAVLLGFLDYAGDLRINGVQVRDVDGDALREVVGLLAQRSHVFDTTLGANITLGRMPDADPRVARASADAQLLPMIDALPEGAQTMVGAFGTAVSGGEAQRIALARLLLEPRPLVVLDEPAEHLDAQTAAALEGTLRQALTGRSAIVVTHRLAEIDPTERVLVLEHGRMTASGTAAELAARPGWFADRLADERRELDLGELIAALPVGRAVPRG